MEWADDVVNRPRRANAGSRMMELLATGLDDEEEEALQALSDAFSSDSSFTLGSDEEAMDEVESDFDAEEVAGTLEGETVETEASVRRAERQERRREREKKLQRSQAFSRAAARDRAAQHRARHKAPPPLVKRGPRDAAKDGDREDGGGSGEELEDGVGAVDLRQRVRHRPPPTIPLPQRLAEAHARAAALRAAQAAADSSEVDAGGAVQAHRGMNVGKAASRVRRPAAGAGRRPRCDAALTSAEARGSGGAAPVFVSPRIALYETPPQRVRYSSGVSVMASYGVPTVVSFSLAIPPALRP